jgi:hypothetical protein
MLRSGNAPPTAFATAELPARLQLLVAAFGHRRLPFKGSGGFVSLESDSAVLNQTPRLLLCLSMIFSEKPVSTFPDHALGALELAGSLPRPRQGSSAWAGTNLHEKHSAGPYRSNSVAGFAAGDRHHHDPVCRAAAGGCGDSGAGLEPLMFAPCRRVRLRATRWLRATTYFAAARSPSLGLKTPVRRAGWCRCCGPARCPIRGASPTSAAIRPRWRS